MNIYISSKKQCTKCLYIVHISNVNSTYTMYIVHKHEHNVYNVDGEN